MQLSEVVHFQGVKVF